MESIADVDIDRSGVFKYILIRVAVGNVTKHIVRGYGSAEYHGAWLRGSPS